MLIRSKHIDNGMQKLAWLIEDTIGISYDP